MSRAFGCTAAGFLFSSFFRAVEIAWRKLQASVKPGVHTALKPLIDAAFRAY